MAVAWLTYETGRIKVPAPASVRETLEHKLWFDELYDAAFFRPSAALARALDRVVERPVIAGSLTALGFGAHEAWSGTSRVQTGLVRSYVLALASALAIMVVVFVSVR
jgi:NADH:ubiquinone oxidoreductase subunit 5 (subunit L)/multisubunit Na+/H+ antiporter MnhA subunit